MRISAVIIAFNEEANIAAAIDSARFADEIVVVDSGSTDLTREIAIELGARVLEREWNGFSEQNFAISVAAFDWILSLDADERISPELRREIESLKLSGPLAKAYRIPRLSIYLGREIRHGGWYPDYQIRLFDRNFGKWNDRIVHESFTVGTLRGDILHFSVRSTQEHSEIIARRYAPLTARQMLKEGRRTGPLRAILAGISSFLRSYILRAGFLDGFAGFQIAYFAAHNAILKHLILYELLNGEAVSAENLGK
ncbi:MAG: glycosyltransferase family 2 protein [Blastocatellia bacterium]